MRGTYQALYNIEADERAVEIKARKYDKIIANVVRWTPVSETKPPHGEPVWLWSQEWVHEDFNRTGVRDGHYIEGEGFVSCGWDPCGDVFTTDEESVPQKWAFKISGASLA